MTAEDDTRTLIRLLWRAHLPDGSRRGPRQRLTVDEVVNAAVELADREGLAGLSVRAVSSALGVRPMSFYTYVPSKEVLTTLMVDAVAAEDPPSVSGEPLRARLIGMTESIRDELVRHPWLLEISTWRQVTGPHRLRRYERQLGLLVDSGLSDIDCDRVISMLTAFAVGNARETIDARRATVETRLTDAQWWDIVGPELADVMPEEGFPLAGRVGALVGELHQAPGDPHGTFDFGLERLLDGVETHLGGTRRGIPET
ncbi:TetR/AcrR family transcriptional regulator [Williamsia maris]|uniref:Transcriptional regulator, TetR family n=1 Tax=Williamsia maris TaxID=72806 RepID=A0ABT1HIC5_9NOCA|nr:transcriptional regulator, TetR family [Williamsia maris]